MSFSEISTYQVKLDKVDDFENVMKDAVEMMRDLQGCIIVHLIKRTHYIKEMQTIRDGMPPDKLTRIIKCMRYSLYWEFDTDVNYGLSQKQLYETYWKAIEKCLLVPHDKFLGEVIL